MKNNYNNWFLSFDIVADCSNKQFNTNVDEIR